MHARLIQLSEKPIAAEDRHFECYEDHTFWDLADWYDSDTDLRDDFIANWDMLASGCEVRSDGTLAIDRDAFLKDYATRLAELSARALSEPGPFSIYHLHAYARKADCDHLFYVEGAVYTLPQLVDLTGADVLHIGAAYDFHF